MEVHSKSTFVNLFLQSALRLENAAQNREIENERRARTAPAGEGDDYHLRRLLFTRFQGSRLVEHQERTLVRQLRVSRQVGYTAVFVPAADDGSFHITSPAGPVKDGVSLWKPARRTRVVVVTRDGDGGLRLRCSCLFARINPIPCRHLLYLVGDDFNLADVPVYYLQAYERGDLDDVISPALTARVLGVAVTPEKLGDLRTTYAPGNDVMDCGDPGDFSADSGPHDDAEEPQIGPGGESPQRAPPVDERLAYTEFTANLETIKSIFLRAEYKAGATDTLLRMSRRFMEVGEGLLGDEHVRQLQDEEISIMDMVSIINPRSGPGGNRRTRGSHEAGVQRRKRRCTPTSREAQSLQLAEEWFARSLTATVVPAPCSAVAGHLDPDTLATSGRQSLVPIETRVEWAMRYISSLKISGLAVSVVTCTGQGTDTWYLLRVGYVTGSTAYAVMTTGLSLHGLARIFRCAKPYSSAAMQRGLRAEGALLRELKFARPEWRISRPAILQHPVLHYVRFSPDAAADVPGHGPRLVELKTSSDERVTPERALTLHRHQIQLGMAVMGCSMAMLVLRTHDGKTHFIDVPADLEWRTQFGILAPTFYAHYLAWYHQTPMDERRGRDLVTMMAQKLKGFWTPGT
jgi:hypothetical protein